MVSCGLRLRLFFPRADLARLDDRVDVLPPSEPTVDGLPTPRRYWVAFALLFRGEEVAMGWTLAFWKFVDVLDPEAPRERSEDTLLDERVETRRGMGARC